MDDRAASGRQYAAARGELGSVTPASVPHARRAFRRLVILGPVALLAVLATPIPASAGVFSATGLRCTIVGSSGDERLTGTPGDDVICGLGGDDRINGAGGNDVVD